MIILANVLNFFNDKEIKEIIKRAKKGLIPGGLIYINFFDANDPSYHKNVRSAKQKSEYTFYRPKSDSYLHFFTQKELDDYFNGYEKIKASETFMLDIGHGEPHYHGTVEVIYRK